jgi:hypothetical protein
LGSNEVVIFLAMVPDAKPINDIAQGAYKTIDHANYTLFDAVRAA